MLDNVLPRWAIFTALLSQEDFTLKEQAKREINTAVEADKRASGAVRDGKNKFFRDQALNTAPPTSIPKHPSGRRQPFHRQQPFHHHTQQLNDQNGRPSPPRNQPNNNNRGRSRSPRYQPDRNLSQTHNQQRAPQLVPRYGAPPRPNLPPQGQRRQR